MVISEKSACLSDLSDGRDFFLIFCQILISLNLSACGFHELSPYKVKTEITRQTGGENYLIQARVYSLLIPGQGLRLNHFVRRHFKAILFLYRPAWSFSRDLL
jgi:hypothetical protein